MDMEEKIAVDAHTLQSSQSTFYIIVKRTLDILLSIFGLLLLLPVFGIIAALIKIDDPENCVFFNQERVGKNEQIFKMYKFRSMYSDAEERLEALLKLNEIDGAMFKMKVDPRVTPLGRILRKFSIDELPQLYNVLKGDMSIVGPRPPLVREVKEYSLYDKQRLLVRPGITGLWQVSGRNSLSFHQMVELDIQYIKNLSLWNDLKILIKTVKVVVLAEEAY